MKRSILHFARQYVLAGFSIIPIRTDGSKAAAKPWKKYQIRVPNDNELRDWFGDRQVHGIALVGGAVSGNLEVLDIDDRSLVKPFEDALREHAPNLLDQLTRVKTPNGRHYAYRHGGEVQGNQKLALDAPTETGGAAKTLIETRGQGGYVVAPKSPKSCHPSGKRYVRIAGPKFSQLKTISAKDRLRLLTIARGFNRYVETIAAETGNTKERINIDTSRPGDDFNQNAEWDEVLEPHGWKCVGDSGDIRYWRRPGKAESGWSATTGLSSESGRDLLCVFSSNAAPFRGASTSSPCSTHSKFDAFALLNCKGDHGLAALELAEQGYGGNDEDYESDLIHDTPFSKIEATEVEWLWPNRIPIAKLTVLAGDPSVGKSFFFCDLAARVSTGTDFPDGSECAKGTALLVSCEDDPGDTLRPRLERHNANLANVRFVTVHTSDGEYQQLDVGNHLDQLEILLQRRPNSRLLVFDPISAYLGNIDSNSNSEVRRVLGPLCELAQRHKIAVIGISHLTKKEGRAVSRTLGSMAFVAAARASWIFARDPKDRDRRLMLQQKNNLADSSGLAFRITDGRIIWENDPVDIDPDSVLKSTKSSARELAVSFLKKTLQDGPMRASEVERKGRLAGITLGTLRRAKTDLGIESTKLGSDWQWRLPTEENDHAPEGEWIVD